MTGLLTQGTQAATGAVSDVQETAKPHDVMEKTQ